MNALLRWAQSPECSALVATLLHTLWQGGLLAVLLAMLFRHVSSPAARYRCSLGALIAIMFCGVVTWGFLHHREINPGGLSASLPIASEASRLRVEQATTAANADASDVFSEGASHGNSPRRSFNHTLARFRPWSGWLALAWIAGATLMLLRAMLQVVGADGLRRSSRPLADPTVSRLLAEAQRALRMTRTVRLATIDKLTSPVAVGLMVPTVILPLSLLSTLAPEQIRCVLLHELAHIRRGDYLANLFQLLVEALLFFNPSVWWISHQVRREREACCDAIAIGLSGAPAEYARTLLHVAEKLLRPLPDAALAFGAEPGPSSLVERVQRMLVPGYRPSLGLTRRALLAALFVGGVLLFLSATAARVTVAAVLSPRERIERIEQKMTAYGVNPSETDETAMQNVEKVLVTAKVRLADGSPLPKRTRVFIHWSHGNVSGLSAANVSKDGVASNRVTAGQIWIEADVEGFAPAVTPRLDGTKTNFVDAGELIVDRGFDLTLQLTDADSGRAVTNGTVRASILLREAGSYLQRRYEAGPDSAGRVVLPFCVDQNLNVTINAPGYTIGEQSFDPLPGRRSIDMKLKPGAVFSGRVVDKLTDEPILGATLRIIYQKGPPQGHYQWTDESRVLGETDAGGRFTISQLRRGTKYWLGISAPAHESIILEATADRTDVVAKLGPELLVRGRVLGSLEHLRKVDKGLLLHREWSETFESSSYGEGAWVPVQRTNNFATFQFVSRLAGPVTLSGGENYREIRDVTAPIEDWVVDLDAPSAHAKYLAGNMPQREVIFRFAHRSGVSPGGTVAITVPDSLDPKRLTAHTEEKTITNGEVRVEVAIGGRIDIEPRRLVGYWFDKSGENYRLLSMLVTNGPGPMIVEIPLVAAGALYATARNADGSPALNVHFGVEHIAAPGRRGFFSRGELARPVGARWVSGPLPLGGTYQAYGWRDNAFSLSRAIQLTGQQPDADIELRFSPGQSFEGRVLDADGNPFRDLEVKPSCHLTNGHDFGLRSVLTDDTGRFGIANATPDAGKYFIELSAPGFSAQRLPLNFQSQPQTFRLQRGHKLAGVVVQAGTGRLIPRAEVRTAAVGHADRPMLTEHTDDRGRFEFTSLADVNYTFFVDGAQLSTNQEFRADNRTNLVLAVKLYEWSQLKPAP